MGAYIALHGDNGTVSISENTLLRMMQVENLSQLKDDLSSKNIVFEECKKHNGKLSVTFKKWVTYQLDSTMAERQKASRCKRRGEERRGEEIRKEEKIEEVKEEKPISPVSQIILNLNSVCKTNYKPTSRKTIDLIQVRMKEGFTVDDFRTVIDKKYAEWGQDEKMSVFLRPETLFGTKFESYLNQVIAKPMSKNEQTINRVFKQMEELENDKRRSKDVGDENDIIIS